MAKKLRKDEQIPEEDRTPDDADWMETTFDVMLVAKGPENPEPEPEEETESPILPLDFPEEGNDEDKKFGIGEYWVHYFQEASPFGEEPEKTAAPREDPEQMEKQAAGSLSAAGSPEVDEIQTGKKFRTVFNKLRMRKEKQAVNEENVSAAKAKHPRRGGIIVALVSLGVLVAGAIVIAEPWVPAAQDDYAAPQPQLFGEKTELEVGQSAPLSIPLGENEQIYSVESSDMDVLDCSNDVVTAIGEWDNVTVTVTTQEKEVPQPELKPFKIFGLDLTGAYNSLRAGLRNLLGIEKKTEPRTELRTLGIYQMEYYIQGYTTTNMPTVINLYTNDRCSMILDVPEGMDVQFECEGGIISVDQGNLEEDEITGYIASSGYATGQSQLLVRFGFIKEGSFVAVGAVLYKVEVLPLPSNDEQAVFASGSYNGTIPVD